MAAKYVDITDNKYTRLLKTIATVRICVKMSIMASFVVCLVILLNGLSPYITGSEEWENMPFTLSQIEAIFSLLVIAWMMNKAGKVL